MGSLCLRQWLTAQCLCLLLIDRWLACVQNSWDRAPYITTIGLHAPEPSVFPQFRNIHHNFMLANCECGSTAPAAAPAPAPAAPAAPAPAAPAAAAATIVTAAAAPLPSAPEYSRCSCCSFSCCCTGARSSKRRPLLLSLLLLLLPNLVVGTGWPRVLKVVGGMYSVYGWRRAGKGARGVVCASYTFQQFCTACNCFCVKKSNCVVILHCVVSSYCVVSILYCVGSKNWYLVVHLVHHRALGVVDVLCFIFIFVFDIHFC